MLQRSTQVGEFYVMSPPTNVPKTDGVKGFMDMLIYDEESDRHVKITWEKAYGACCIGGLVGNTPMEKDGTDAEPAMTLADWKTAADGWSRMNTDGWNARTAATLKHVCIVVARPFIEHSMLSAVLAVSGGDTGATIFGPSDMQISVRLNPNFEQDPNALLFMQHRQFLFLFVSFCRPTPLSRRSKGARLQIRILFDCAFLAGVHRRCLLPHSPCFCVLAATTPATSRRSSPSTRTCS